MAHHATGQTGHWFNSSCPLASLLLMELWFYYICLWLTCLLFLVCNKETCHAHYKVSSLRLLLLFKIILKIMNQTFETSVKDLNLINRRKRNLPKLQSVNSHQSLQFTVWTLLYSRQQLLWWIRQVVESQVQLCQMRVGLHSWGHNFTVSVWESKVRKSVMTQILQHIIMNWLKVQTNKENM